MCFITHNYFKVINKEPDELSSGSLLSNSLIVFIKY
jgi:hypothetical protein